MAIVLIGGQVVFGILDRDRQAVVAVGVGGIVLCHAAAHRSLDDLYAVVSVVDRFGHPVTALGRGQVPGDTNEAIEVVVGIVSDGYRGSRRRAGGGGSGDRRTPGFEQLAGDSVAVAADQPLGTDLCCRADQVTIIIIGENGLFAQRVGTGGDAALRIECLRSGVSDIGTRAVDQGEVTYCIIGEGRGEFELQDT